MEKSEEFKLTDSQRRIISDALRRFREFLKTERGKELLADRRRRIELFEKTLGKEHIDELTEPEFSQIISSVGKPTLREQKIHSGKNIESNRFYGVT